jgi:hypothetical protein
MAMNMGIKEREVFFDEGKKLKRSGAEAFRGSSRLPEGFFRVKVSSEFGMHDQTSVYHSKVHVLGRTIIVQETVVG